VTATQELKTLSDEIHELQVCSEERLKAQHGRFNVFTTLLSAHDEVRLHTRFIHELLNPAGTHDCGKLFLKLFFETLQKYKALEHDDSPTSESWTNYSEQNYSVRKEVRKDQGQLDLLLESDSHLLVIENKIEAYEQPNQIERYVEYLESQKTKVGQVIYLTLDGKPAETHNGKAYLRISFREHIMAWLERCLQATDQIVSINQVLIQYKKVVQQLGKTADHETMKAIKELLRTTPNFISQIPLLISAADSLRQDLLVEFMRDLKNKLSQQFDVTDRPGMKPQDEEPFPGLVIQPRDYDFTQNMPYSIWVEVTPFNSLVIGLEAKWQRPSPLSAEMAKSLSTAKASLGQQSQAKKYHYATAEKTWTGTYWPVGWHDLAKNFIRHIDDLSPFLDEQKRAKRIDEIDQDVSKYLELLKDSLKIAKEGDISTDQ
tara:strand:+ start:784 stop:2076 length:1293 start_codon:yes stop_codon:yes gene_type:complete